MAENNIKTPLVSIVVLNWNGWYDTIQCLESLYQLNYQNYFIILVDNNSKDNSVEKINQYCSGNLKIESKFIKYNSKNKPIHILEYHNKNFNRDRNYLNQFFKLPTNKKLIIILNNKNFGFTGGNNIGIAYSLKFLKPDYIFLLNNDTIIEKDCLTELVKFSETERLLGIIGPEIRFLNKPDKIQFEEKFKGINQPTEVDWVSGCAFLIKTKLIKKIGLLDPIFHLLFEETDYYERARKAGYKIFYYPSKNVIYHKFSASFRKVSGLALFYYTRNYIIYTKKHSHRKVFFFKVNRYIKNEYKLHLKPISRNLYYFIKGVIAGLLTSIFVKRL